MGKIVYKYIDPPRNTEKAATLFRDTIIPLLHRYWEERGAKLYGAPFNLNIVPLMQTWMGNNLVLVIAYDDDKPVGFMFGVKFVPMLYNSVVLQSEIFYGETSEIEEGMFKYLGTIVPFMNVNELWLSVPPGAFTMSGWHQKGEFKLSRYVKE